MAERIQARRTALGLTQGEAGERINLSQESWSKIENGRTKFLSRQRLKEIATALDVDAKWIENGGSLRDTVALPAALSVEGPSRTALSALSQPATPAPKYYLGPKFREIRWDERFPRSHPYAPSQQEYRSGAVVRPRIADKVVERLQSEQWAVVLGRGASGKTVLGNLLTLDEGLDASPCFYLNVAEFQNLAALMAPVSEEIFETAEAQALFIVDNIHINEDVVHDIWRVWSDLTARPLLLLLGREVQTREGSRFSHQSASPISLLAREHEARGVFNRLARRFLPAEVPLPSVPDDAVAQWVEAFGGPLNNPATTVDLMMLSAAIHRKLTQLLMGKWLLLPTDAQDEVRAEYLNVGEGERLNLLRLSALPDDFRLPQGLLHDPYGGFPESIKGGIVFESQGRDRRLRYSFAHAALGHLIASAYGNPSFLTDERNALVEYDVEVALAMAQQFALQRRLDDAKAILDRLKQTDDWLGRYQGHLGTYLIHVFKRLTGQNVLTESDLIFALLKNSQVFKDLLEKTPLAQLFAFLRFVGDAGFFELENMLKVELLAYERTISDKALDTQPEILASFLTYLEQKAGPFIDLRKRMIAHLNDNIERLISSALRANFGQLVGCLKEMDRDDLGSLRQALIEKLKQPEILSQMGSKAISSSFDHLAALLNFAAEEPELAVFRRKLIDELQQPERLSELANRACREKLAHLLPLLSIPVLAEKLVLAIRKETWDFNRAQEQDGQPDFFVALAKKLRSFGRPELAQVPARIQMVEANARHWGAPHIFINALSNVVSLASPTSIEEQRTFLDTVIKSRWLDEQYQRAPAGGLAGSLFSLLVQLDRSNWTKLSSSALDERAFSELLQLDDRNLSAGADVLSLFGMCAAINPACANGRQIKALSSNLINKIAMTREPSPQQSRITILQMQLWLGVRAIANLQHQPIQLQEYLGACMLAVVRANASHAQKTTGFNAQLLSWLETSERNNWVLKDA
jgi:transcriptional regulator with XRE-family HTH domain